MASLLDACIFYPAATGTADFTAASPKPGWRTLAGAGAVDGAMYRYRAYSTDETEWEIGTGIYSAATDTLSRAIVLDSSNSGAKTEFSSPPAVAVTIFAADFATPAQLAKVDFLGITQAIDLDVLKSNSDASKVKTDLLMVTAATNLDSLRTTVAGLGTASTRNVGLAAGNVPVLDAGGKVDASVLPAIAITDAFTVASQAEMLTLTAETGDIAIRTDLNKTFVLSANTPSVLAAWKEMLTPTDLVLSVVGLTGAISQAALKAALALVKGDVGLGNVDNTSDVNKPVSTAQETRVAKTPSREFSGASATLTLADAGGTVRSTGSSAAVLTIPAHAAVPIPVDTYINVEVTGTGQLTIAADAGVTPLSYDNKFKLPGQNAACALHKIKTNEWLVIGPMVP